MSNNKTKRGNTPPHDQLKMALFTLNILNFAKGEHFSPFQKHWTTTVTYRMIRARWKDPLTGEWRGPDPLITAGRGFGCVFPTNEKRLIWVPARDLKYYPPTEGEFTNVNDDPEGPSPPEDISLLSLFQSPQ